MGDMGIPTIRFKAHWETQWFEISPHFDQFLKKIENGMLAFFLISYLLTV